MPKTKTNRAAAKRLRFTGGKGIKRKRAFRRHLLTSKPRQRKRGLRSPSYVDPTNVAAVLKLLPNG